jgi:hypothetical protein
MVLQDPRALGAHDHPRGGISCHRPRLPTCPCNPTVARERGPKTVPVVWCHRCSQMMCINNGLDCLGDVNVIGCIRAIRVSNGLIVHVSRVVTTRLYHNCTMQQVLCEICNIEWLKYVIILYCGFNTPVSGSMIHMMSSSPQPTNTLVCRLVSPHYTFASFHHNVRLHQHSAERPRRRCTSANAGVATGRR